MVLNKKAKELMTEIKRLSQSRGLNDVFTTFLEISAVSLGAQMDLSNATEREKRYQEIAAQLPTEELSAYGKMLALLYLAVQHQKDDPCDILGAIFHELQLNNEWNGQFFTPDNVSRMMASITIPSTLDKEVMTICEPACGSGTMIIASAWAMQQNHIDHKTRSLFIAKDLDIRCVWMTYIQMMLYEIPAIVVHGNSLTSEEWSRWYTPWAYVQLYKLEQAPAASTNAA